MSNQKTDTVELIADKVILLPGERVPFGEPFACPVKLVEHFVSRGSAHYPNNTMPASEGAAASVGGGGGNSKDAGSAAGEGEDAELTEEDREALIRDTLAAWLDEDPEKKQNLRWTKAGKPRNETLDNALGFNVTNAEVDPIFDDLERARKEAAETEDQEQPAADADTDKEAGSD